jgi:hypothetical protein
MRDDGGTDHPKPGLVLPTAALPSTEGTAINLATLSGRSLIIGSAFGCSG